MDERKSESVAAIFGAAIFAIPMIPLLFVQGPVRTIAAVVAGAAVIRSVIQWLNRRDDSHDPYYIKKHPPTPPDAP